MLLTPVGVLRVHVSMLLASTCTERWHMCETYILDLLQAVYSCVPTQSFWDDEHTVALIIR